MAKVEIKKSKIAEKIRSLHIQSHSYPSRREIITKCESGSFHPILTTKGMGQSIADKTRTIKAVSEGCGRIFGDKPLNVASDELRAEFEADNQQAAFGRVV